MGRTPHCLPHIYGTLSDSHKCPRLQIKSQKQQLVNIKLKIIKMSFKSLWQKYSIDVYLQKICEELTSTVQNM